MQIEDRLKNVAENIKLSLFTDTYTKSGGEKVHFNPESVQCEILGDTRPNIQNIYIFKCIQKDETIWRIHWPS